ncbi:hypothetical protein CNYM01_09328 [Colletotrichum nymphaeae SA-01]|uniref:Uncharacterized protein n=1 Tax=Colletotrichum nymphaeae SA-01 TaxID=1460502 RepID=A0A135UHR9_9PEZI|nr:hypothetical protein CNYM01_09328 [Colletotrichum nymphaeae SA-01]
MCLLIGRVLDVVGFFRATLADDYRDGMDDGRLPEWESGTAQLLLRHHSQIWELSWVTELRVAFQVIQQLPTFEGNLARITQLTFSVVDASRIIQESLLHDPALGRAHNEKG